MIAPRLLEAIEHDELLAMKLHPEQRTLVEGFEATPNAVVAAGRRGGKTLLASAVCLVDSLFRPDLDALVRPGEVRFSIVVATNIEQARRTIESARLTVEASPVLRGMLKAQTADELLFELPGGARSAIRSFPCSSRGVRSYAASTIVLDEAAHHVSTEDGDATAQRVFDALRPATAQFGQHSRALLISSPMGTDGFFATQWKRASEGSLPGWAAYKLTSQEMNPTLTDEFMAMVEMENPETFASEYLAMFEAGGNPFFDRSRILVDEELGEADPDAGEGWIAGLDPGYASDSFGVALLGQKSDGLVLGPVRAIEPDRALRRDKSWEMKRDAQDRVTAEVVELCREYAAAAYTDQHESQAVVTRSRELGLKTTVYAMNRERKHAAFKQLRDALYRGTLVLPDHGPLLDELMRVKVKLEQTGPKIILPRSSQGHCDQVQALALAAWHQRFVGKQEQITGGESLWAQARKQMPVPDLRTDECGPVPSKPLSMRDLKF